MDNNDDNNNFSVDKEIITNCRKPIGELGKKTVHNMNKHHEPLAQWGVSNIIINQEDKILDIGCGGGVNIERFTKLTKANVFGVDYSEVSVEESIKHNQEKIDEGQVKIFHASVSNLPFSDESFDWVTGFETVYFWPDLLNDFKEIYRVLKHDGHIFICNGDTNSDKSLEELGDIIDILDMNLLSGNDFIEILQKAGFSNINIFTKKDKNWICVTGYKK